ncbi:imidazole glycerol phosphate synthase subunit HisH [Clostridium diolis]|uniref:Imidazole glycerol phosphate synthase subunit HisH n=1 Tax=Clostridium diolis TaxID=223919 RepID=A0AAV3VX01_9CLOT|nr:imidazole glycerol phosphate synthase subunit HisH [Clostridium diolis]QES75311.1 imidazole glycerol phosphate synthase subunit HisH [Clostridium diolis]GEA29289.1 imidazole glycerol phosphate synthase subunit HisH [Clostridium diolis]
MKVYIVDYGMGNLMSVKRAFEECEADEVCICNNPEELFNADRIVLPGVGSFYEGMNNLNSKGWTRIIKQIAKERQIPILGICLGMQLFASKGYEGKEIEGLNLIDGEVKKLIPSNGNERIPHIGWNEIYKFNDSGLFLGIDDGTDFYFVHSYHFIPKNESDIMTKTLYCGEFVSSISNGKIYGVQFHPEKSHKSGFMIIKNFLSIN